VLSVLSGSLLLILVFYGGLSVAHPWAARWMKGERSALRWLATWLLFAALLTALSHLLLALAVFHRVWLGVALLACVVVTRRSCGSHAELAAAISRDLRRAWRGARAGRASVAGIPFLLAPIALLLTAGRVLVAPPIGWDTLTYHYVKAAMWVQTGAHLSLDAPGGWSIYRLRLAGGDLFSALAMLPFHSDLVAAGVDLLFWCLVGLATYALGAELGLRVRERRAATLYVLFVPALWMALGSGYVDGTVTAFATTGLAFGARHLRSRAGPPLFLSILALSLACAAKITALPILVAAMIAFTLAALRKKTRGRNFPGWLAAGVLAGLAMVGPWLLQNLISSGYPLGLPLELGGIRLGPDLPAFEWYQSKRNISPYTLAAELRVFPILFALPSTLEQHLSALSLPCVLLAPIVLLRLAQARSSLRPAALLIALVAATLILAFYSPSFSLLRLEWTVSVSRFLLPALPALVVLSFRAFSCRSAWRNRLSGYLVLAACVHASFQLTTQLPAVGWLYSGLFSLLLAAGCILGVRWLLEPQRWGRGAAAAIWLLALTLGLAQLRTVEMRHRLFLESGPLHPIAKSWIGGVRHLEDHGQNEEIAVTGGGRQNVDHWFMYFFMGHRFQNRLHYVPIGSDGAFIPFGPDRERERRGSYGAWEEGLREARISYVLSFAPRSVELGWMEARPGVFTRVAGDAKHWGLYRLSLPSAS